MARHVSITYQGDPHAISKVIRAGRMGVHEDSKDVGEKAVNLLKLTLGRPGRGRLVTTKFFTTHTGRVVPYGQRTPHRASAPGDPPAPDTFSLLNSIKFGRKRNPLGSEVEVGSDKEHAIFTEFGTRRMKKRPWFRPTMTKNILFIIRPWERGIIRRERLAARAVGGSRYAYTK